MQLKNKVAFITGAASGIGAAIAERYAQEGAQVIIADLNLQQGQQLAETLRSQTQREHLAIALDVTDEHSVNAGVAEAAKQFGRIDILVSNAGVQHIAPIHELNFKDWRKILAVHLDGAFLATRACLQHMYKNGHGGKIIYLGSIHSKVASMLKAPYVAAKHGIIGLTRAVAKEGAQHGVAAYAVCPSFVRTPLVEKQIPEQAKLLGISEQDVIKKVMLKDTVDGEFTTMEELVDMIIFLGGQNGLGLTGQSFMVTHGWHMG